MKNQKPEMKRLKILKKNSLLAQYGNFKVEIIRFPLFV